MKLSLSKIKSRINKHPGWAFHDDKLTRNLVFKGFPEAIAFVTRLAFDAQAADHHPDLLVSYKRVTVTWSTHDAGGVTAKDFEGIKQTEAAAKLFGG